MYLVIYRYTKKQMLFAGTFLRVFARIGTIVLERDEEGEAEAWVM